MTMSEEQTTTATLVARGAELFEQAGLCFGHGCDNAFDEALFLAMHVLQHDWEQPVDFEQRLSPDVVQRVETLYARRINQRIPAAYLTGEAWLLGLRFKVDQRVLVPRSPIAELIGDGFQPWLGTQQPRRILDLCCGSGCLGIASAYAFPDADVVLADLSEAALDVANENVALHSLQNRVSTVQSDLFAALGDQRFDVIICNPPYVDAEDLAEMPQEFHHEPGIGLASGVDGLDHARKILRDVTTYLQPQGLLVMEVGNSWPALEAAYPTTAFTWVAMTQGGHGVLAARSEELPRSA